jgi:hypothetical protein
MRLSDVLSTAQVELLLDQNYIDNGAWIPSVDGRIIPGVTVVTDDPPEIQLASLKTDARIGPAARLSFFPDTDYMLRLSVPTQQQSVLAKILGRGAEILDMADANTNNTVGHMHAPTAVEHGLYGIFKVDGTVGDWDLVIPRLPHADFVATNNFNGVAVPGTTYDNCFSVYNPTAMTFEEATKVGATGGTLTWLDKYIGSLTITGMSLPTQVFQYDPATSGLVTLAGKTVSVDERLVDPDLKAGDNCVIVAVAYLYSQLTRAGDWQITQPLSKPTRCVIDLYRSLSDVTEFDNWVRRRHYWCEQTNLPAASTDGSKNDPNIMEYAFVARSFSCRLGGAGRYYDTQYLVAD